MMFKFLESQFEDASDDSIYMNLVVMLFLFEVNVFTSDVKLKVIKNIFSIIYFPT